MMPNLLSVINRFEETIQFTIIKKTVTDHELVETSKVAVPLYFEGNLQGIPADKLLVKSEGERAFHWHMLYTDMMLERDWQITDSDGITFIVMSVTDWKQAGYMAYEIVEGPKN